MTKEQEENREPNLIEYAIVLFMVSLVIIFYLPYKLLENKIKGEKTDFTKIIEKVTVKKAND